MNTEENTRDSGRASGTQENDRGEIFVNVYVHTPSVSEEVRKVWWNMKFRIFYILLAVLSGVIVAAVILLSQPLYLLYLSFPVLELILLANRRKKIFRMEADREKEKYKDGTPTVRVEIGKDISVCTVHGIDHVPFSEIAHITETGSLIVILSKKDVVITLKKDGFLQGTAEECMRYIRSRR